MRAFVTYVRPLLEYATPVWTSYHKYLVLKLEGVQRKIYKKTVWFKQFILFYSLGRLYTQASTFVLQFVIVL